MQIGHGGFGLTSARKTSPAAFLGSMAAVAAAPVFAPYTQPDCPLPSSSLLHDWIDDSMRTVLSDVQTSQDETTTCEGLLPPSAAAFFYHFAPRSPSTTNNSALVLQHELSSQATASTYKASLQRAMKVKKQDGGRSLAHLRAVSAPRAWTWKSVSPTSTHLELTDTQYRVAARLNLGLQPGEGAAALPDSCPVRHGNDSIRIDPWHFLTCKKLSRGEITVRHDDVGRALHRLALTMGLRAQLEPRGLHASSGLRPDLLLSLPGRLIMTDIAVCHPLAPGWVRQSNGMSMLGKARWVEAVKKRKYAQLASQRQHELLPFVAETCGGLAPSAVKLMQAMAQAAAVHLALWSRTAILRELVGSVAIAVQRGSVMAYLEGFDRSLLAMSRGSVAVMGAGDEDASGEEEVENGGGE